MSLVSVVKETNFYKMC